MSATMKNGQPIQTFVRIRPFNRKEIESNTVNCVEVLGVKELVVKHKHDRKYITDGVFSAAATQKHVFNQTCKPLIAEVLEGYSCSIFAYGQTGSGKTYTISGPSERELTCDSQDISEESGIIIRFFHHLFDLIQFQHLEYTVRVSYIELYNEEIFDLLSRSEDFNRIRLYEDDKHRGSVILQGVEDVIVKSRCEVSMLLQKGHEKKRMAPTSMNTQSSRSHTVLITTVHIKETNECGEEIIKTGKMYFVDLAGSENIGKSNAIYKRAREAGSINTALLTLTRVIKALVEKYPHIPYRESKLTRILQESLGGRTKSTIIVTISPGSGNVEEIITTLDFASRAKNITNKPEVNKDMSKKALIDEYYNEISKLRDVLADNYLENGVYIDESIYIQIMKETENSKSIMSEKIIQFRTLSNRIENIRYVRNNILTEFAKCKDSLANVQKDIKETTIKLERKKNIVTEKISVIALFGNKEQRLKDETTQLLKITDELSQSRSVLNDKLSFLYRAADNNKQVTENIFVRCCENCIELAKKIKSNSQNNLEVCEEIINLIKYCNAQSDKLSSLVNSDIGEYFKNVLDLGIICQNFDHYRKELDRNKGKNLEAILKIYFNHIADIQMILNEIREVRWPQLSSLLRKLKFSNEDCGNSISLKLKLMQVFVKSSVQDFKNELGATEMEVMKSIESLCVFSQKKTDCEINNIKIKQQWSEELNRTMEKIAELLVDMGMICREKMNQLIINLDQHNELVEQQRFVTNQIMVLSKNNLSEFYHNQECFNKTLIKKLSDISYEVQSHNETNYDNLNSQVHDEIMYTKKSGLDLEEDGQIVYNRTVERIENITRNQEDCYTELHDKCLTRLKVNLALISNASNCMKKMRYIFETTANEIETTIKTSRDCQNYKIGDVLKCIENMNDQMDGEVVQCYLQVFQIGDTPSTSDLMLVPQKPFNNSNSDSCDKIVELIEEEINDEVD